MSISEKIKIKDLVEGFERTEYKIQGTCDYVVFLPFKKSKPKEVLLEL